MSLEPSPARDGRHARDGRTRDGPDISQLSDHPNAVMTFLQWCSLNGFSPATGKRLMRARRGPKIVQLSPKRIGIRNIDNDDWQKARLRDGR